MLMYHLIGTPRSGVPYPDLFVSTADFAARCAIWRLTASPP